MFGFKPNKHLFATLASTESKELYKRWYLVIKNFTDTLPQLRVMG